MRTSLFLLAALASGMACAAATPSDVSLEQDAVTKQVTISYALAADAVVTLDIETNGVKMARAALAGLLGDVNRRVAATTGAARRTILWKPTADVELNARSAAVKAIVKVWPDASPPDYLMHDLRTMRTGYYETEDELPYGPVTNSFYKSCALVMRKMPAAGVTWWMGNPAKTAAADAAAYRQVSFTNDYYFSIYEATIGQCGWLGGTPKDDSTANCKPATSAKVDVMNASVLPGWRTNSGLSLRLPTSAEWEYACRAVTAETRFCPDAELADYARIPDNADWDADHTRRVCSVVGTRKPNPWGLYDMLGNMNEYMSDWSGALTPSTTPETNPTGPETGTKWVYRGGSFMDNTGTATSFFAGGFNSTSESLGFRLVLVP